MLFKCQESRELVFFFSYLEGRGLCWLQTQKEGVVIPCSLTSHKLCEQEGVWLLNHFWEGHKWFLHSVHLRFSTRHYMAIIKGQLESHQILYISLSKIFLWRSCIFKCVIIWETHVHLLQLHQRPWGIQLQGFYHYASPGAETKWRQYIVRGFPLLQSGHATSAAFLRLLYRQQKQHGCHLQLSIWVQTKWAKCVVNTRPPTTTSTSDLFAFSDWNNAFRGSRCNVSA